MKIFGLGFHKTGSTTLETALITLGYNATGKKDHLFTPLDERNWSEVDEVVEQYDAFRDMPWPIFFRELDQYYPDSKFILTVRDSSKWIASCVNHYKDVGTPLFARIYGEGNHYPLGKEDIWIERYLRHNREVREYFVNRSNNFLEVDWEKEDSWDELCTFLERPIPKRPFPHANKGKYTIVDKAIRRLSYLVDKKGFKKRNRDL